MGFYQKLRARLDALEPLTVRLLTDGLHLACGLVVMAIALQMLVGRVGGFLPMLICAQGAYSAGVGVMVATLAACLLGELYVKERGHGPL